ncbi:MAG: carboxymuconolactone decarboxylase family protein, partial [Candidatus Polarisedimenticolia bacterium]
MAPDWGPFLAFRDSFGFVPNLFRAQTLLPRVIEAEAGIASAVLLKPSALERVLKESILLQVAAAERNVYCVTAHANLLRRLGVPPGQIDGTLRDYRTAGLSAADQGLLDYALKLHRHPTWIGPEDVERLRGLGFTDEQILEANLVAGLTGFLCTLSTGLGVSPDFEPWALPENGGHEDAAAARPSAAAHHAAAGYG